MKLVTMIHAAASVAAVILQNKPPSEPPYGSLVKWLRRRILNPETRVQFSQELPIWHLSLMVRTPDFQSGNAEFKSRRCHQKMLR